MSRDKIVGKTVGQHSVFYLHTPPLFLSTYTIKYSEDKGREDGNSALPPRKSGRIWR